MKAVFSLINQYRSLLLFALVALTACGKIVAGSGSQAKKPVKAIYSLEEFSNKEEVLHFEKLVQELDPDFGEFNLRRYKLDPVTMPSLIDYLLFEGLVAKDLTDIAFAVAANSYHYLVDYVAASIHKQLISGGTAAVETTIKKNSAGEWHKSPTALPSIYVAEDLWRLPEDQQLFILGHEITHVQKEHSAAKRILAEKHNQMNCFLKILLKPYFAYREAQLEQTHEFDGAIKNLESRRSAVLSKLFLVLDPLSLITQYFESHPSPEARIANLERLRPAIDAAVAAKKADYEKLMAQADYNTLMAEVD